MKKIILILLAWLTGFTVFGQDFFSQTVVSAGGGQTDNATYQTSWSIGEVITGLGSGAGQIITQGFQQGTQTGNLVWTGAVSQNWGTQGNWTPAIVPNQMYSVTLPSGVLANQPVVNEAPSSPAKCLNLDIQTDRILTIAAGKALTVDGALSNNVGNNGLVIENGASLLHNSSAVPATVKYEISGSTNLDQLKYHFVGLPTQYSNPTSNLFLGSYLYKLDPLQLYAPSQYGKWVAMGTATTTQLANEEGYMIYYPEASVTYTFQGDLNNGVFPYTLTGHAGTGVYTYNLIPNPYPSPLVWNTSSQGWSSSAGIGGVCHIWNANSGNYSNISSSTTSYIPVGQAFMVLVSDNTSPSLTVNNHARAHSSQAFYKSIESNVNQLVVQAYANNYSDETVLNFSAEATDGFDLQVDGKKLFGLEDAPQLYTRSGEELFSINNQALFEGQKTVPLGFKTKYSGLASLNFSGLNSFDPALKITLNDKLTNESINLRNQPNYTFSHISGNEADRFQLVFGGAIGMDHTAVEPCRMWINQNTIYISAPTAGSMKGQLFVYDATGKILASKQIVLGDLSVVKLNYNGFAIAKLISENETLTVKGVFIQ